MTELLQYVRSTLHMPEGSRYALLELRQILAFLLNVVFPMLSVQMKDVSLTRPLEHLISVSQRLVYRLVLNW